MPQSWTHLIRFIAEEDNQIHLGNIDATKYPDVGLSIYNGEAVEAKLVTGSVFSGTVISKTMHVKQVSISKILVNGVFLKLITDAATKSRVNIRSSNHPMLRLELSRSCPRSQYADP